MCKERQIAFTFSACDDDAFFSSNFQARFAHNKEKLVKKKLFCKAAHDEDGSVLWSWMIGYESSYKLKYNILALLRFSQH